MRIWVDDPTLGCGERHLIVTSIGPTHVQLYSAAALTEIKFGRREFEQHAEPYGSNAATVLGILERNLRSHARLALEHDKRLGAAVAELLRSLGEPMREALAREAQS